MGRFVPLSIPNFQGNEKKYANSAISEGWVSTGGAYITQLEEVLSVYLHTHSVAACQSGTAAIHLALVDCGVGPGDMVIVPSLTFIAAVNPVRYQFAEPVFMDCDDSLCMDPVKLKSFCEEECDFIDGRLIYRQTGSYVKAVIIVHVFGNMADMEAIMEIAQQYRLIVIEDATEALGTHYISGRYAGQYAGTIGDYGAFSFNGNKIITTGGGGAVTAKKREAVKHLKYLSTQAKDDPKSYIHNEIGYNYRMTNLQAAIGVAQMEELSEFIECKHRNYELYQRLFEDFDLVRLTGFRSGVYGNCWFYALELSMERLSGTITDIILALEEKGVQTRSVWGLIHEQVPYRNFTAYKMERALWYKNRILNIPCSTQLQKEDVLYVADMVKEVLNE